MGMCFFEGFKDLKGTEVVAPRIIPRNLPRIIPPNHTPESYPPSTSQFGPSKNKNPYMQPMPIYPYSL